METTETMYQDQDQDQDQNQDYSNSASPSVALSWLRLLNAPENNHDPRAFSTEGQRLRDYRLQRPSFSVAAVSWPRYAIEYWDVLKPEVMELFSPSETTHNFAQWVLEYARETNPNKYKLAPTAWRIRRDLVNDIYSGEVSPLHMAAVLGLPDLAHHLAKETTAEHRNGQFGSPLFCALMGPTVLKTGTSPTNWSDVFHHPIDTHRLATIRCVLDHVPEGDLVCFTYSVQNSNVMGSLNQCFDYDLKSATLAGLSFWAAATCDDLRLIEDMLSSKAQVDDNLLVFLEHAEEYLKPISESSLHKAFITLLDYSLGPHPTVMFSYGNYLQEVLEEKMEVLGFQTTFSPINLNRIPDSDFASIVISSISDGKTLSTARLAADPRFDATLPVGKSGQDGTIAHLAVSGDQFRIVQILLDAGSDFARVDDHGRPPLLVFESLEMLEMLICKNGFSTSVSDNDGRNLWHYSCATNDIALMNWLCENDPEKEANIQAVTNDTRWSPLDEAIGFIVTTKDEHYLDNPVQPRVLMRLLEEMKMLELRAPPNVNVHLAVTWGSLEIVDSLVAIGADLRGTNEEGNTILHKLNFTATPELVKRLVAILGPEAGEIRNHHDQFPAETIFTNTFEAFVEEEGQLRASWHPACAAILDRDTYIELLRSGATTYRNTRGQGIWERVSKLAIGWLNETKKSLPSTFRDNFFKSVSAAVHVLISLGALHEFELDKNSSAMETLQLQYSGRTVWEPRKSTYLELVLCHSGKALLREFYTTKAALTLLIDAWWSRCFSLVGLLARTGMPLQQRHSLFDGLSFIEVVLTQKDGDVLSRLYGLLNDSAKKYFVAHAHIIYKVILHSKMPQRRQMLLMLLSKGLNPNPELAPDQENYYLPAAIEADGSEIASLMLKFGADPTSGRRGYNAFIAAAARDDLTLMADVICVLEDRHPAFAWDSEYEDVDGTTFNALQMAAHRAHDRMLLLLLQTPLRRCINQTSSRNMATPAHLAARSGSVECIQVLQSWGADMEIRDAQGLTPLDVALQGPRFQVADFLRRSVNHHSSSGP